MITCYWCSTPSDLDFCVKCDRYFCKVCGKIESKESSCSLCETLENFDAEAIGNLENKLTNDKLVKNISESLNNIDDINLDNVHSVFNDLRENTFLFLSDLRRIETIINTALDNDNCNIINKCLTPLAALVIKQFMLVRVGKVNVNNTEKNIDEKKCVDNCKKSNSLNNGNDSLSSLSSLSSINSRPDLNVDQSNMTTQIKDNTNSLVNSTKVSANIVNLSSTVTNVSSITPTKFINSPICDNSTKSNNLICQKSTIPSPVVTNPATNIDNNNVTRLQTPMNKTALQIERNAEEAEIVSKNLMKMLNSHRKSSEMLTEVNKLPQKEMDNEVGVSRNGRERSAAALMEELGSSNDPTSLKDDKFHNVDAYFIVQEDETENGVCVDDKESMITSSIDTTTSSKPKRGRPRKYESRKMEIQRNTLRRAAKSLAIMPAVPSSTNNNNIVTIDNNVTQTSPSQIIRNSHLVSPVEGTTITPYEKPFVLNEEMSSNMTMNEPKSNKIWSWERHNMKIVINNRKSAPVKLTAAPSSQDNHQISISTHQQPSTSLLPIVKVSNGRGRPRKNLNINTGATTVAKPRGRKRKQTFPHDFIDVEDAVSIDNDLHHDEDDDFEIDMEEVYDDDDDDDEEYEPHKKYFKGRKSAF